MAIGRGASVDIIEEIDVKALAVLFEQINQRLDQVPAANKQDVDDAKGVAEQIKQEAAKGDKANKPALERHFRAIARMEPAILDVVTATLISSTAGIAMVVRKIVEKARVDAGLQPSS